MAESSRRVASLGFLALVACAPRQVRDVERASDAVERSARRGDAAGVVAAVLPSSRAYVDVAAVAPNSGPPAVGKTISVRPEALLFIAPDRPVAAQWSEHGWAFAEDPLVVFDQSTPRAALRSLVRASREGRWETLLGLAPERYRIGLSVEDLRRAWTEGEHAEALARARDRLAGHLGDPIRADAHEAALDLGDGQVVRLEREGERWVVVDF